MPLLKKIKPFLNSKKLKNESKLKKMTGNEKLQPGAKSYKRPSTPKKPMISTLNSLSCKPKKAGNETKPRAELKHKATAKIFKK
jgi:hypothetical protein